jgi:heterodisulfide reductase subunit D
MKYAQTLQELERAISGCLRCNRCHYGNWPENYEICPIFSRDRTYTYSAGGLMYLAKALLRDQLEYSQKLSELVYTCSTCRGCDDLCMIMRSVNPEMPLSDIIRLMRYELVKRGFIPEKIKGMYEKIKDEGNFSGNGKGTKPTIPEEINSDEAETVLYAQCFHGPTQDGIYESALRLLKKIGKPVQLFTDGGCCGSTLFDYGFWDELPRLVDSGMEKLKDLENRTFLFINPHCQEFISNRYEMIASSYETVKTQHFSEMLAGALKEGSLKSKEGEKVKVSYHDPCMLGRGLGVYEPPREVLSYLKGVELVEMKRNRENNFCCGAKAVGEYFADFPEETAGERIREFKETGADLLITACPYCKEIFQKVLGEENTRVRDLIEFVEERTK